MDVAGGCYCGAVRYRVTERPVFKALCYCRACQHVSGGGPQFLMVLPPTGFSVTQGTLAAFARPDIADAVTRRFCPDCGTHIVTARPGLSGVILKIGTLDDPGVFRGPKAAIFVAEKQAFHEIPDGLPQYAGMPGA